MTRLFYAPPNRTPVEITGRKFRIPPDGPEIHNPRYDPSVNILKLVSEVPEPNPKYYESSPVYQRSGNVVNMTWSQRLRPVAPIYAARVEELRQLSIENALVIPGGFNMDSLRVAYAHGFDALAGGTGPYSIPKVDGTWASLTKAQLSDALSALSSRANDAAANVATHLSNLQALRDASDVQGLADYDLTTGWP